jgi:hypothetical protein
MLQNYRDERSMLFVMEAFISANRALLGGIEQAIHQIDAVMPHYCPGQNCQIHKAAVLVPLERALGENTVLGDFIAETLRPPVGHRVPDSAQ